MCHSKLYVRVARARSGRAAGANGQAPTGRRGGTCHRRQRVSQPGTARHKGGSGRRWKEYASEPGPRRRAGRKASTDVPGFSMSQHAGTRRGGRAGGWSRLWRGLDPGVHAKRAFRQHQYL